MHNYLLQIASIYIHQLYAPGDGGAFSGLGPWPWFRTGEGGPSGEGLDPNRRGSATPPCLLMDRPDVPTSCPERINSQERSSKYIVPSPKDFTSKLVSNTHLLVHEGWKFSWLPATVAVCGEESNRSEVKKIGSRSLEEKVSMSEIREIRAQTAAGLKL